MWTKPTRPIKIRSTFTALLLTGACLLRLELLVSRVERTAGTAIRGRECPVFLEFISSAKDVMRWDHTSILLLSFRVCPQWGFGGRRTGTPAQPVVCHGRIQQRPGWARGRCRISPPRFLAECCNRQLNQGSFILLYFRLFTFSDLYWVCLSVFSCTVLFVSISQVIGCEDRLRNDLYCVEWSVKLYSNQPTADHIDISFNQQIHV